MLTTYIINIKKLPTLKGVIFKEKVTIGSKVTIQGKEYTILECEYFSARYDTKSDAMVISDGINYMFSTKDIETFLKHVGFNSIFDFNVYAFGRCSVEDMARGKVLYFAKFVPDYNIFVK